MISVYIAMPYGDHNDPDTRLKNTHAAMDMWIRLVDAGLQPFCPHLSHFLHERSPRSRQLWLLQTKVWVEKCDCLLSLGSITPGMMEEIDAAHFAKRPVFYSVESLGDAYGVEIP